MSVRPSRLGPWEILEEIGRGGYGSVYRARHERSGAVAAVKVILAGEGASPEEIRRFQREIALARALDHPGIVRVLDVGDEGTRLWYAMELIEGMPLYRLLAEETLPWRRAVEIARDAADALAHAHARGVLHRDVKPGNILVGRKGADEDVASGAPTRNTRSVFLTDFGLARLSTTASRLTRTGIALGTPEYMSPEQAQGEREKLGPPTDVWGLGCVLYEMLAGRLPFEGTSAEHTIEAVVLREPVPLRRMRPDVPPALERVVRVCLAKRPSRRYRDAGALRDDLDRVLRGERPRARPPTWWRRRLLAGGALSAAAVWGAWGLRTGAGPEPLPPAPGDRGDRPDGRARAVSLASQARSRRTADPRGALGLLGQAIEADPGHASADAWRIERGLLLWAQGEGRLAVAEWRRVPTGSSELQVARLYEGIEALFRFHRVAAIPALRAASGAGGRGARLADAALCLTEKDWISARSLLAGESGWETHVLRGYLEDSDPRGDRLAAIRDYTQALAEGIPLAWVYGNRGVLRQGIGQGREAVEDFETAARLSPSDPRVWLNLGGCRAEQGDPRGALADIERALQLAPGHPAALCNRAAVRMRLGDLTGATADYDVAIRAQPEVAGTWNDRAVARLKNGDLRGALGDLDEAIRLDPQLPRARKHRGEVRATLGDLEGARADHDAAILLAPADPATWMNRGDLRRRGGDLDGAIGDLDEAIRLDPLMPEPRASRGLARANKGDYPAAVEDLATAVRLAPREWKWRDEIERVLDRARAAAERGH